MTIDLQRLISAAKDAAKGNPCVDGDHHWSSDGEGDRPCPTGCRMCGQIVYRCRTCGTYDYGTGDDSPGLIDCKSLCGNSLTGWRGGHLDLDADKLERS